ILKPGCAVDQEPRCVYLCCHLSQFELYRLKLAQWTTELHASFCVANSFIESAGAKPQSCSPNTCAESVEGTLGQFKTFSGLAEHLPCAYPATGEFHLAYRVRRDHLQLFANAEAGSFCV